MYFYALESLTSNNSNHINDNMSDVSEIEDEGLGSMTDKSFKKWTLEVLVTEPLLMVLVVLSGPSQVPLCPH